MWYVIYRTWDLSTNDRIIAYYKKELRTSHIIDNAKVQMHYGTKEYRKLKFKQPSWKVKRRIKALVSNAYKNFKKEYGMKVQLGAKI